MSFANAAQAGINVGNAFFQPRYDAQLRGLQAQSIQQAIRLREQQIEQVRQGNELMAEFFGKAAKQQFLAENDPIIQGALRFQREQQVAALDPSRQAGFVGPPTPFDQINAGSLSQVHAPYPQPTAGLGSLEAARANVASQAEAQRAALISQEKQAQRQRLLQEGLGVLREHPEFGPAVLDQLAPDALEGLIQQLTEAGEIDRLRFENLKRKMRSGLLPSGRPIL